MNQTKFFNLSDITTRIQVILQPHIGKRFWVKAEISSGRERGGSFYCDPAFALGELELKKKEILDRLTKDGLLEPNKSLTVPLLPQRIGLVTSKGSAACNDILKTFSASGFGFKIYLADSIVQGLQTERSVLKALDALEKQNLDLVIIARGGGSKTDLFYLDNEAIARRIP